MTDNNTQNATQQNNNNTPPEGNGAAGKTFTQEEVNSIVRERLARERAKGAANPDDTGSSMDAEREKLDAEREKLDADRKNFECERYCKENSIDTELVHLIGADEPEAFKKKAESLRSIFAKATSGKPVGTYTTFSTGAEHGTALHHEPDGTEYFKPSMK